MIAVIVAALLPVALKVVEAYQRLVVRNNGEPSALDRAVNLPPPLGETATSRPCTRPAASAPGPCTTEVNAFLRVQEIHGWEPVSRAPGSPGHVLGVMNRRGSIVPVLDVRGRLGTGRGERTSTSVVIVVQVAGADATGITVGCLVDGVPDVINLSTGAVRPAPNACVTGDTHFLSGVATADRQLLMTLAVGGLFKSDGSDVGRAAAAASASRHGSQHRGKTTLVS